MMRTLLLFAVLFFLPLCSFAAESTTAAVPEYDSNQPIEVTAKQLEVLQEQRQSIFTGDVVVVQGEMTMSAAKLTMFLQQKEDQLERLVAAGGVKVTYLDRVATSTKAIYYQVDEKLVLVGNAEVVQGQNKITGEEITLYLQDNRSVIKSSETGRVKAVIIPAQQMGK